MSFQVTRHRRGWTKNDVLKMFNLQRDEVDCCYETSLCCLVCLFLLYS